MKFFKFELDVFDYAFNQPSRKIHYIHYLNIDNISNIIISSDEDYFTLITKSKGDFKIHKDYLDNLLKLVEIKD